jgi:hypothetical protein
VIAAPDAAPAPELQVAEWLNAPAPVTLASLRGRVVVIEGFQMLCPGCVLHGLPQAQTIRQAFGPSDVAVLGLHTVFEHHEAMGPVSLRAFLHEYRIDFPVGIDAPGPGQVPRTMAAYDQRGTPALTLIDRAGRLRAHHLGQVGDMMVGAQIAALVAEGGARDEGGGNYRRGEPTAGPVCRPATGEST